MKKNILVAMIVIAVCAGLTLFSLYQSATWSQKKMDKVHRPETPLVFPVKTLHTVSRLNQINQDYFQHSLKGQ